MSLVAAMAAELCSGVVVLLDQDNVYSAAALIRQLVEVEYLACAFAEDNEEAAAWLRAAPDERKKIWTAGRLLNRSKGKFRGSDYMHHCEMGGHPTPRASDLLFLKESESPQWWFEVVIHGVSVWTYTNTATAKVDYQTILATEEAPRQLDAAITRWRAVDPAVPLLAQPRPSAVDDPAGFLRSLIVR